MNILLIDDDEVTNYINKRIFKLVYPDANIVVAYHGIEALSILSENMKNNGPIFDYILVDISMPEMDGWEFIDEVATDKYKSQHESKFVMLTSSVFDDDILKAKSKPLIKKFYSKPIDKEKIMEMQDL